MSSGRWNLRNQRRNSRKHSRENRTGRSLTDPVSLSRLSYLSYSARPTARLRARGSSEDSFLAGAGARTIESGMVTEVGSYVVRPLQRPMSGSVRPPGSKSYTNRALVLASLARGESTLRGALFSDDTLHMATALRALGFELAADETERTFSVAGAGGRIPAARASVFVGNSGTTARFLAPVMALGSGVYELDGNEAMRRRPIQPLLDALNGWGARASSLHSDGCPPVRVEADGLEGGNACMPGGVSSQYFSALLMIGPCTRRGITLEVEGELVSKPYIEVTAQAMQAFGANVEREDFRKFSVEPTSYP